MTTLVLQSAGSALGGALGGPIGAAVGSALGAAAGGVVAEVFGSGARRIEGPRLKDVDGIASTEGAPVPRLYGRARLGGQIIWATRPLEVATLERGSPGGFGGPATPSRITYTYFANLAVGLCEGPIAFVRRIWADGREIDRTSLTIRVHPGTADQMPDPLIAAKEGPENAPAYRGLAYIVFERLPLAPFGNRVPQFTFEVVRPVHGLGERVRAVCLIPGATEFGYDPRPVVQVFPLGGSRPENRNQLQRRTDVLASLDALQALCPNLAHVAVVVSWFGDDLRAGACTVTPRVERVAKVTYGDTWRVGDLAREDALPVGTADGVAAYGGTPSDAGLIRLIGELRERGLRVALYPFVMMDVARENARPDPWSGAPSQPARPWRGRITCDPAPGRPGSPDGTAAADAQVTALFGTAAPGDFTRSGGRVSYAGPPEWSLRRQVLHYAHLCVAAGGVDAFVIGSEFVGLTRVRGAAGGYPAVAELARLAADVRGVLGAGTRLTYAADWTEYGAHVRENGAEIRFPLDALWAHPAIDAVGIDMYPPLTDWRDEPGHDDGAAAAAIHDPAFLADRPGAGEAYDWFYPDEAARVAQDRRPITDGAAGKPWIFRAKDVRGWWENPHVERSGGIETATTAWVPRSKPIWFTELGVPAVDKGTNGPNAFPDAKSSEGRLPPFSTGARDDLIQIRGLEAWLDAVADEARNPVSPLYGGPMIDRERIYLWAWDARPFPAFPALSGLWADGPNWAAGHWLTGRLEGLPLDRLIAAILDDFGLEGPREIAADGFADGYVVDRPLSARAALEPLARLYGLDVGVSAGVLRVRNPWGAAPLALGPDDLVRGEGAEVSFTRAQDSDLPALLEIGFTDAEGDYRRACAPTRRLPGPGNREAREDYALVLRREEAQRLAERRLAALRAVREQASFALSPRLLAPEPGDRVTLPGDASGRPWRIERIADGPVRTLTAVRAPAAPPPPRPSAPPPPREPPPLPGRPAAVVLDLPLVRADPPVLQHLAATADPWPGGLALWREGEGGTLSLDGLVERAACLGETLHDLPPGPLWRWDRVTTFAALLSASDLASVPDEAALAGANWFAVRGPDGAWEILAAARIVAEGPGRWRFSRLLRGLGGSEPAARRLCPAGAPVVRLDEALVPLAQGLPALGRRGLWRLGPPGLDPAGDDHLRLDATPGPAALRPLAPVHLAARRTGEGVRLAWIRRGRIDADGWEGVEIPLGEESERYRVAVHAGGADLRVWETTEPRALYPAAQELADFGAPVAGLAWSVAQAGASTGWGEPAVTLSRLP